MKKKYLGMRRLFGTKGQHNDEVDLSQEKSATKFRQALIRAIEDKSAHGKETLKSVELSVKRRESIEVRIKANGDSLVSSTSTMDPHEAKSRQLSHAEISLSKEEIQAIAKELLAENLVLRKQKYNTGRHHPFKHRGREFIIFVFVEFIDFDIHRTWHRSVGDPDYLYLPFKTCSCRTIKFDFFFHAEVYG